MQNPQQDPGMERRLLLVFVLTFIVLLVSQPLLMKYFKPPQQPAQEQKEQKAPATAAQPAATPAPPPTPAAKPSKQKAGAPKAVETKQAAGEQQTVIENYLYKIIFTNRGAQVKSWILKKYNDEQGHPLELIHEA